MADIIVLIIITIDYLVNKANHPLLYASGGSFFYNFPTSPYILPLNLTSFPLTPTSFEIRTIKTHMGVLAAFVLVLAVLIVLMVADKIRYGDPNFARFFLAIIVAVAMAVVIPKMFKNKP